MPTAAAEAAAAADSLEGSRGLARIMSASENVPGGVGIRTLRLRVIRIEDKSEDCQPSQHVPIASLLSLFVIPVRPCSTLIEREPTPGICCVDHARIARCPRGSPHPLLLQVALSVSRVALTGTRKQQRHACAFDRRPDPAVSLRAPPLTMRAFTYCTATTAKWVFIHAGASDARRHAWLPENQSKRHHAMQVAAARSAVQGTSKMSAPIRRAAVQQ